MTQEERDIRRKIKVLEQVAMCPRPVVTSGSPERPTTAGEGATSSTEKRA